MKRKPQCKDVPTRPVLEMLSRLNGQWATWGTRGHEYLPSVAEAMPPGTPLKVQHAKMRRLIRRGLVDGCTCGCRGDFVITDAGRLSLTPEPRPERSG